MNAKDKKLVANMKKRRKSGEKHLVDYTPEQQVEVDARINAHSKRIADYLATHGRDHGL